MVQIENVLLLTDFSENAKHALHYARALTERFGAKLHVLHVIGNPASYIYGEANSDFPVMEKRARIKARWEMDKYRAFLGEHSDHDTIIKEGGVLDCILETIAEKHIDNLVIGSEVMERQGGGLLRSFLSDGITHKITRGVRCHIWVIP